MRQNIFMGGGPFAGAALGQGSGDAIDQKMAECKTLFDQWSSCLASKGGNRFDSACRALQGRYETCKAQVDQMIRQRRAQPASGYQWRAQPSQSNYQWDRASRPISTTPASQPISAAESEISCYFCANLEGAPTYWMTPGQADQWNSARNAGCTKVPKKECQEKYGQPSPQQQTARQRVTSTLVSQYVNPYGSMMSGIRVQNPELLR
jgi:hypothetical protein